MLLDCRHAQGGRSFFRGGKDGKKNIHSGSIDHIASWKMGAPDGVDVWILLNMGIFQPAMLLYQRVNGRWMQARHTMEGYEIRCLHTHRQKTNSPLEMFAFSIGKTSRCHGWYFGAILVYHWRFSIKGSLSVFKGSMS